MSKKKTTKKGSAKKGRTNKKRVRTPVEKAEDLDKRVQNRLAQVEADESEALTNLQALSDSWGADTETPLRKAARAVLTDFRVSEHFDRSFAELRATLAAAQAATLRLLTSNIPKHQSQGLRALSNLTNQMLRRREQDVEIVKAALQASAVATYEQFRATLDRAQGQTGSVEQLNRELAAESGPPPTSAQTGDKG